MDPDNPWRMRLLLTTVVATLAGYGFMVLRADSRLRTGLLLLTATFVLAGVGIFWRFRDRVDGRIATANVALGAIVHLVIGGVFMAANLLWQHGVVPALSSSWAYFLIGVIGVVAAFFTWTKATSEPPPLTTTHQSQKNTHLAVEDFAPFEEALHSDPARAAFLRTLARIACEIDTDPQSAKRLCHQEARRLVTEAKAARTEELDDDVLSQAAALLEWGVQKIPELSQMDVSDILMGQLVASINARHSDVETIFVDHRKLLPLHPISRSTAIDKCNDRAAAAKAALPLLRENDMRLSEALIAGHDELALFRSVTGFQIIEVENGAFVTFEGNGRREALQRAFGEDEGIEIECRLFTFDDADDEAKIRARCRRVREKKGVL